MKITKANQLLAKDIEDMSFEQLLNHRVNILDAWRQSKAEYGYIEAVKNGFYKVISSDSAYGYSPTDIWLTQNLLNRLNEIEYLLNTKYREYYIN